MSVQPQEIQQPLVYPNALPPPDPSSSSSSSSSSHSRGSFGTVFIVLAVILVVSALACVFGRLCNKRSQKNKAPKHEKEKGSKKSHHIRPVEREPREPMDLEFGFDRKRIPMTGKPLGGNGGDLEFGFAPKRIPSVKHGVKFKLPENRHGDADIEFRPGP